MLWREEPRESTYFPAFAPACTRVLIAIRKKVRPSLSLLKQLVCTCIHKHWAESPKLWFWWELSASAQASSTQSTCCCKGFCDPTFSFCWIHLPFWPLFALCVPDDFCDSPQFLWMHVHTSCSTSWGKVLPFSGSQFGLSCKPVRMLENRCSLGVLLSTTRTMWKWEWECL